MRVFDMNNRMVTSSWGLPVRRLQDTQFKLASSGMEVASLHGELGKLERQTILTRFRNGKYRALVYPPPPLSLT